MKAGRPINLLFGVKLMPLNAVTEAGKAAEDPLPAAANFLPRRRLAENAGGGRP